MGDYGIMRIPVGPAVREARRVQPAGGGWLAFAGTMVLVAAIVEAVYGIDAISRRRHRARHRLPGHRRRTNTGRANDPCPQPGRCAVRHPPRDAERHRRAPDDRGPPRMVDRRDGDRPPGDLRPVWAYGLQRPARRSRAATTS